MTSAIRTRIGRQSSTAARTSPRTFVSDFASSLSMPASVCSVICRCMMDSATVSRVSSALATAVNFPAALRLDAMTGWIIRWTVRLRWLSSAVTESTRNGMSSLTISTTVWPHDQPSLLWSGLNTRILVVPGLRDWAYCHSEETAPRRQSCPVSAQSVGDTFAKNCRVKRSMSPARFPAPRREVRAILSINSCFLLSSLLDIGLPRRMLAGRGSHYETFWRPPQKGEHIRIWPSVYQKLTNLL